MDDKGRIQKLIAENIKKDAEIRVLKQVIKEQNKQIRKLEAMR